MTEDESLKLWEAANEDQKIRKALLSKEFDTLEEKLELTITAKERSDITDQLNDIADLLEPETTEKGIRIGNVIIGSITWRRRKKNK